MNFVLPTPSLQHISVVRIAAALWGQADILAEIAQSFSGRPVEALNPETKAWLEIEYQVKSNVSALPLPRACKQQLLNMIKPLAMEMISWFRYHGGKNTNPFLADSIPPQFCWTMRGTVDYARTGREMARDESREVAERYELACINCLEEEAFNLVQLLPERRALKYMNNPWTMDQRDLIPVMTYIFLGNEHWNQLGRYYQTKFLSLDQRRVRHRNDPSINKWLFQNTLCSGNREMCECLFEILESWEKKEVLKECYFELNALCQSPGRSLIYFLSLMNAEQQERIFRKCSYNILKVLLGWPVQALFMEAAAECAGWQMMRREDRVQVLKEMAGKMRLGFQDYDYCRLFWECWSLSSDDDRRYFVDRQGLLESLMLSGKEELMQLVVNEGSLDFIKDLENQYVYCKVMLEASVITAAALRECKETAALNSYIDPDNVEKKLRSQYVSQIVDVVMERRIKKRRID